MKGDFSRETFDRARHYSAVRMQQGRVLIDADWNEQNAIAGYREQTGMRDLIGRCGGPAGNAGFRLVAEPADPAADGLFITEGRYYVDGILVENEAKVALTRQPDLPPVPGEKPLGQPGRYLLYLDVWERHITALEDPSIREVALGGPDTATRSRTVWQVKALPVADAKAGCKSPSPEFDALAAAPTGQMSAGTVPSGPNTDPCSLPPEAGYRGLENQLYRVEVHGAGNAAAPGGFVPVIAITAPGVRPVKLTLPGAIVSKKGSAIELVATAAGSDPMKGTVAIVESLAASGPNTVITLSTGIGGVTIDQIPAARLVEGTFKWSRDNGSVVTAIEKMDGETLTVHDLGRDTVLGFAPEQWVEITDDLRELNGLPGELVQIRSIDKGRRIITLKSAPAALDTASPDGVDPRRHPKLRRWDGVAAIRYDGAIHLEDGVQVRFTAGSYRSGDYWTVAARTATSDIGTGGIEWPRDPASGTPLNRPPFGIGHHYCRIGMVTVGADGKIASVDDCRCLFSPLTRLSGFFYVGGDGQEARPGFRMPQPLRVGLFNVGMSDNCTPVAGARVRFSTRSGGHLAAAAANPSQAQLQAAGNTIVLETDADGIASVVWLPFPGEASQQVEARLLNEDGSPGRRVIFFNGNLSIASEVAYTPQGCSNLPDVTTVQEALDALCRRLGRCHDFLDELRSDGVIRGSRGELGLRVRRGSKGTSGEDRPTVVCEPGVAYVDGCRHLIGTSQTVQVEPSTIGQWIVVNHNGEIEVLLEPIPPEHCALLALVSTYEGEVERIVDVRRDLSELDKQVESNRHGVATARKDARQYVPLLAGTLPDLRYRDAYGDLGYRDGRNRPFGTEGPALAPVFDGRKIWAPLFDRNGPQLLRIDRYAAEITDEDIVSVEELLVAGAFDGTSVWFIVSGGSYLVAFDAETFERRTLPVPGEPRAIMFDGHHIWIATAAATLQQIDVERNEIVRTIALPRIPGASFIEPLALEFDGEYIWVSGTERTLFRIRKPWGDPEMVPLPALANYPPPNNIHHLVFDGSHLWMRSESGGIFKLDVTELNCWPLDAPYGLAPYGGMVFDGSYVWVPVIESGTQAMLYKMDARTGQSLGRIDLPRFPTTVLNGFFVRTYLFDGTHLWYPYVQYRGGTITAGLAAPLPAAKERRGGETVVAGDAAGRTAEALAAQALNYGIQKILIA